MASAGPNSRFLAQKQVSAPSRHGTGTHAKSSIARPQHAQQHTHTPRRTPSRHSRAAAARRRRHLPRLLPLWRRQICAGARCTCRLHLLAAALPLRCLCLWLWLWLWATAAAAPLPVEDREEEAPRAHLRAGTQPARGSNPGRAVRESSSDARRRRRKICTKT